MPLRRAQRRFVQAVQARTDTPQTIRYAEGTVTAITSAAGSTTDGRSLVTVNLGGSTQAMRYILGASSPPVSVGQTVAVLLVNHAPIILGAIGGFPA